MYRMNCNNELWEVVFLKKIIPFFPPNGEGPKPLVEERLEINILCRSNTYLMTTNHLTAVATANNYPNNLHITCCMVYDWLCRETQAKK